MNPAELVVIETFPNRIDAELAHSGMDAAGIDAMISGDDAGGLRPHMAVGGFRLLVRADDAEQAADVMAGLPKEA
jgi:Putative prokaryotic signal transducing protein